MNEKIITLKKEDIQGLNALCPEDWHFDYEAFLHNFWDDDFFYAFALTANDRLIGTGNVFLANKKGWLANIIVEEQFRGKGLGNKITSFLVEFLAENDCHTQNLIATEFGKPVYQKIGFKDVAEYVCFDTVENYVYEKSKFIKRLKDPDFEKVVDMDAIANGENREHLIRKCYKNAVGYYSNEALKGFYLPPFGRGLIIAIEPTAGKELLSLKHAEKGTRTLLPSHNQQGIDYLTSLGLQKGYTCSRMYLGESPQWNPEYIYSYGSGYCG